MRNASTLRWIGLSLLLGPSLVIAGCGPSYSDEELGTMVYEVPDVPGSDETFPMPELDPKAAEEAQETEEADPSLDREEF